MGRGVREIEDFSLGDFVEVEEWGEKKTLSTKWRTEISYTTYEELKFYIQCFCVIERIFFFFFEGSGMFPLSWEFCRSCKVKNSFSEMESRNFGMYSVDLVNFCV